MKFEEFLSFKVNACGKRETTSPELGAAGIFARVSASRGFIRTVNSLADVTIPHIDGGFPRPARYPDLVSEASEAFRNAF